MKIIPIRKFLLAIVKQKTLNPKPAECSEDATPAETQSNTMEDATFVVGTISSLVLFAILMIQLGKWLKRNSK